MKIRKRAMKRDMAQRPVFNLHARFTPEGPDKTDQTAFYYGWFALMERVDKLEKKKLDGEIVQLSHWEAAWNMTIPILIQALRGEIPVELAAEKIKKLVPDKQLLREIFDFR